MQQPKNTKTKDINKKQRKVSNDHQLHRTFGVPILAVRVLKTSAEMMTPDFPPAVEIPWAAALNLVGNTSHNQR
jgi:hypothetical protein